MEPPSRRSVVTGAALAAALAVSASSTAGAAPKKTSTPTAPTAAAVSRAYDFLATSFDRYGSGSTLRLPQSYTGGRLGAQGFVSSFTYDDALVVLAWLARGKPEDLVRARVLADTLLALQDADPIGDGRVRAAYQPAPLLTAQGAHIGSPAANTGNQAWLGLALARLFARTGERRYLDGALRLARWIQATTFDGVRGPQGYTGGRSGDDTALPYKATEHNIDVGAFFAMLAATTGDAAWAGRSRTAIAFVAAMQDPTAGHLWTGTGADGSTVRSPVPADVQSWAYLATGDRRYARAVTWATQHLAATDAGFSGIASSTADTSAVWFEGTAHLALALRARGAAGDDARWRSLLATLERVQATAVDGDGRGVVAASRDGAATGFGEAHSATLHTGTTAWYLLAATGVNPFVL